MAATTHIHPANRHLPAEIKTNILTRHLAEPPACALALLCPEWNLCRRPHRRLEAVTRNTRVDTYTLPLSSPSSTSCPGQSGTVSTNFDHGPGDCLCLPRMRDPRGLEMPGFYKRELVREWAGRSVVVVGQKQSLVGPLWAELDREVVEGMLLLREEGMVALLPFEDDFMWPWVGGDPRRVYGVDGREKEVLPGEGGPEYLFQRLRHLVVNTVPKLAEEEVYDFGTMPSTWNLKSRHNLRMLQERLEYERRANLLLRWDAMERLETLCLDLRGYNYPGIRYLFEEDVTDIARSLWGKNLALLVVAGTRSWRRYPGFEAMEIDEVERGTWDRQKDAWVDERMGRSVNWWQMFARAVRPGGKLVLVDNQDGAGVRQQRLDPHYTVLL